MQSFKKLFDIRRSILLMSLVVAGASSAMAGIIGDTVNIQFLYPDMNTQYGVSTTGVVTATGISLNLFDNQQVTVFGDSVQMTALRDSSFVSATFNGISVQDETNASAFTGFSVDAASNLSGFDASNVSLSGGLLFISFEGLSTPLGTLAQVDFTTAGGSDAPEPSTIGISLLGFGAISVQLFRKKRI